MTKRGVLLSLGHGYSAQYLARLLVADAWTVIGTTRRPEKAAQFKAEGVEPALWDTVDPEALLSQAEHVLVSAGPDSAGCPVLRRFHKALARNPKPLRWIGYLSTTGVYGDRGGDWVDETSACKPSTRRGQWRLAAEQAWQQLGHAGLPVHIFRLAGIYGPGRGPFSKVRSGAARRIVKPGQVFSRIHVEDIAAVLAASINSPSAGSIYNVCDDDPAPPQDVISYAAELLGLPAPPEVAFETADLSPMARSFYAESKRVRNARIREELGVELRYPSYRAGLAELARQGSTGPS